MKTPTDYQEKQMLEERLKEEYKAGVVVGLFFGSALGVIFTALLINFMVLQ